MKIKAGTIPPYEKCWRNARRADIEVDADGLAGNSSCCTSTLLPSFRSRKYLFGSIYFTTPGCFSGRALPPVSWGYSLTVGVSVIYSIIGSVWCYILDFCTWMGRALRIEGSMMSFDVCFSKVRQCLVAEQLCYWQLHIHNVGAHVSLALELDPT
jgi:hypothetical protein